MRRAGLLQVLPLRLAQLDALAPPLTFAELRRDAAGPYAGGDGSARLSVGLVAGCVQRAFFPNVNAATVRVLAAEGCDVTFRPDKAAAARSRCTPGATTKPSASRAR